MATCKQKVKEGDVVRECGKVATHKATLYSKGLRVGYVEVCRDHYSVAQKRMRMAVAIGESWAGVKSHGNKVQFHSAMRMSGISNPKMMGKAHGNRLAQTVIGKIGDGTPLLRGSKSLIRGEKKMSFGSHEVRGVGEQFGVVDGNGDFVKDGDAIKLFDTQNEAQQYITDAGKVEGSDITADDREAYEEDDKVEEAADDPKNYNEDGTLKTTKWADVKKKPGKIEKLDTKADSASE